MVLAAPLLWAQTARADGSLAELAIAGALALLAPSEAGAELTTGTPDGVAPVIGWAYQLPLPFGSRIEPTNLRSHRLGFALEWTPGGAPGDVRVRLGDRYVWRQLELGLGLVTGPDEVRLSPEVGLRLWRGKEDIGGVHVRARVDVAPFQPGAPRAVLTVGWALL